MIKEENEGGFLQWAGAIGISDSSISNSTCLGYSLSIAIFPEAGGRGLAATRVLRKGELILRVPKAALMTTDSLISKDHYFSSALGRYPSLSSSQILSVALLNEVNKGKSSWWYTYLKQLPQSYDLLSGFGLFEIEALQIDDAVWTAEKAVRKSKSEWEEANQFMSELKLKPQLVTFKAWLWASATISSRTMHVPWDTAGCLCPVGDFFNYAPPDEDLYHLENSTEDFFDTNTERLTDAGYDEALASYCFYSKRNYSKGDQVLLSYGTYTNLELLEHYGFLLQENPNDKAFIPLEPEMYSLCSWPKESLYISQNGKPSFALISTLRLWATPLSQRKSVSHIACTGHQISAENEVKVMKWIINKCHMLLENCSTSIEEDKSLLQIIDRNQDFEPWPNEYGAIAPALNCEICAFLERSGEICGKAHVSFVKRRKSIYRWRLAVEWRYGYKKILFDCISHCNKILENP